MPWPCGPPRPERRPNRRKIDERDTVTFNQVYGGGYPQGDIDVETYSDPGTYVGADSNPLFDQDDELVFMAKDAGGAAAVGASLPAGVVAGSGVQLAIHDSLDGGAGFVYLFESDGGLTPDAGADYVSYTFNLLAGSYPEDYNLANGPNPEMSSAVISSTRAGRTSAPSCACTSSAACSTSTTTARQPSG